MPTPKIPIHIPVPVTQGQQVGMPLYNWTYTGSGQSPDQFLVISDANYQANLANVTNVLVTLGLITANAQQFYQYYYQVSYNPTGTAAVYSEGFVPADKLVQFIAANLTLVALGTGPVSSAPTRAKKKR